MSEPFIGEIRIFGFNFAPRSWAFCNGQLLPISQNTALFSLLGTIYGGDGRTTFALPNLEGRAPMGEGRGPGLTARTIGQRGGTDFVTLVESQIPNHAHNVNCVSTPGSTNIPTNNIPANTGLIDREYSDSTTTINMASAAVANTGGSQSHNNMQPYLGIYFCMALQGLYPSRS